jgi:hypothetical protein
MMTNLHLRTGAARPVTDLALALGLVGIDAIARLTPHPTNFTPIIASSLFAGALLGSRLLAFVVPMAGMAASDVLLGFPDWRIMIVIYAALAMPAALGRLAQRSAGPMLVFSVAATSSVIFFMATNFAVWIFSGMYTADATGLLKCYVAALPFFPNSIVGDLLWTAVFFGAWRVWQFAFFAKAGPMKTGCQAIESSN